MRVVVVSGVRAAVVAVSGVPVSEETEGSAVVVVVVVLLGGSEVSGGAEPEDDTEGAVSAEPEVGGAGSTEPAVPTLGTGSACSVPGSAGAEVVVVVVSGRATVPVVATPPTATQS